MTNSKILAAIKADIKQLVVGQRLLRADHQGAKFAGDKTRLHEVQCARGAGSYKIRRLHLVSAYIRGKDYRTVERTARPRHIVDDLVMTYCQYAGVVDHDWASQDVVRRLFLAWLSGEPAAKADHTGRLYICVDSSLPSGRKVSMATHAMHAFFAQFNAQAMQWHRTEGPVVVVHAPNPEAISEAIGRRAAVFRDYGTAAIALLVSPVHTNPFRSLPLVG